MILTLYLVLLHILALHGLYWAGFWGRNYTFLKEFHTERRARIEMDKKKDGR